MKVVVENTVILNGGDAAIQVATVRILQAAFGPDIEIVFFDSQPEVAGRHYPEFTVRELLSSRASSALAVRWLSTLTRGRLSHSIKRAYLRMLVGYFRFARWASLPMPASETFSSLQTYADADLVLTAGGTYLVPQYGFSDRVLEFEKDLWLRKGLVFFTQSLGPFDADEIRKRLSPVFARARLVLLRDHTSRRHVEALTGTIGNIQVVADSVFVLAKESLIGDARAPLTTRRPKRVVVSVRAWRHFQSRSSEAGMARYREAIREAVTHLVTERGAEVTFLSTCQGIPEYHFDDSRVAQEIMDTLDQGIRSNVTVDGRFRRTDELLAHLGQFDAAIATRMHMAILCLCKGVPVLPIAYEQKTVELFRDLDLEEWVTSIETIEAGSFVHLATRWWNDLDVVTRTSQAGTRRLHASALSTVDILRRAVADNATELRSA